MWSITVGSYIIALSFILGGFKTEAKTYYFHLNKTSNEFMIRNRLNLNNSAYNYPSGEYLSELRNNITRRKYNSNEVQTHPLLDPEWDYNWKNISRRKLPSYIYKFYEAVADDLTDPIRILFNANPQNSTILRFNLSNISTNENMSNVELHFYFKVTDKNLLQKSLILRLYQMENSYFNETSLINPDAQKLLNVIYIYQADSGWQVFKLTNTIQNSLIERKDLFLFITIAKPNEEQFSFFKDTNVDNFRTFLILKSESSEGDFAKSSESVSQNHLCRKNDFYIDFTKLNWMKFIIAPPGYHAFNCFGTCYRSQDLPNHRKVTNSAPEFARKSLCCIPVQYSRLTIMFYDKSGNIVIKPYEDMIASACGCR